VVDFVTPFRDRTLELLEDKAELNAVLLEGSDRANAVAESTLADVYERVGFVAPRRSVPR
jgi:tryptophanyl-tRNA synthetase